MTNKQHATEKAREFRNAYGLTKWRISVWENLGWHWELSSPSELLRFRPDTYSRRTRWWLDVHMPHRGVANFFLHGNSPSRLLKRARTRVREILTGYQQTADLIMRGCNCMKENER